MALFPNHVVWFPHHVWHYSITILYSSFVPFVVKFLNHVLDSPVPYVVKELSILWAGGVESGDLLSLSVFNVGYLVVRGLPWYVCISVGGGIEPHILTPHIQSFQVLFFIAWKFYRMWNGLLLHLDVNSIEGVPYNCLSQKVKTTESSAKFKTRNLGTRFLIPAKTNSVSVGLSTAMTTHNLLAPTRPVGQKTSLVNTNYDVS